MKAFMAFDTFPNAFNSPRYRRKLSLFILSSNLTTAVVRNNIAVVSKLHSCGKKTARL